MNEQTITGLRAALVHSPSNLPLRLLLADSLLALNRLAEAEEEYSQVAGQSADPQASVGLATIFFRRGNFSACNVILEETLARHEPDPAVLVLYARALLREGDTARAVENYRRAVLLDPGLEDTELDGELRSRAEGPQENLVDPADTDTRFLQRPGVTFADVGGMDAIKREIELKIVNPLLHPELYAAYGKKVGGGILLYGPPGCGKTFIARATAGQVRARFINVTLNDILDMWIGNSEKNLHDIFELARANAPCVLFIDEIDALGASRRDMRQSSGRGLINQFLQELDGIDHDNEGVLIVGATNAPWNLDAAFRRPGRFDRILFVPPPDTVSRRSILSLKLAGKPVAAPDLDKVARRTEHFSGADLDALIDIAVEEKLEAAFADGIPRPLDTEDLLRAAKKHRPSTQEWFATARNFALYANDAGLYDDILAYLKINK
ncbi:ATP-binding protein [Neolewinella litorea]|uniref:AAA family ATPase n=1 Tax=Neolewinella litorea TaxID=2562452 RepID=A0A4S4NJ29_9BACT|nr:ATP-binding protein [Neolewinella litorea]THH39772.1 AAA family ATPase [Neolewinella litorea]